MKTEHIVLPTDFSANAENAIDYALSLFEKIACRFHILNAFQVSPSGLESTRSKAKDTRLFRAIKGESERSIYRLMSDLKTKNENPLHTFESHCAADSLVNAIGRIAVEKNIRYIVMGTKGSSAVKEVFMGSSTIKVLQKIDFCPIIAVPSNYNFKIPDKIAFATNFEHTYSKAELLPLTDSARLWNSEITIVHAEKGKELLAHQKTAKKLLSEKLHALPHTFVEVNGHSKISEAIMAYTEENENIGMIAMINYWHSFFEKLTKENIIKRVAFYTEVPFLIFPLIDP